MKLSCIALIVLILLAGTAFSRPAHGLQLNERVYAKIGVGSKVYDAPPTQTQSLQFTQRGGVYGTVIEGAYPLNGVNWWGIHWDSEPPFMFNAPGFSSEGDLAPAPIEGDVLGTNDLFEGGHYYTLDDDKFWPNFAPSSVCRGSGSDLECGKYPATSLGNCTWYVSGRMKELGFDSNQVDVMSGNAEDWYTLVPANQLHAPSEVPKVGWIAQWVAGTHVAVVEGVRSSNSVVTSIIVSESIYIDSNSNVACKSDISHCVNNIFWRHRIIFPNAVSGTSDWPDHFIEVGRPDPIFSSGTEIAQIQPGPTDGKDTTVGTHFYKTGGPDLEVLYIGGNTDLYFSYVQFDLSTVPPGTHVQRAELWLYGSAPHDPGLLLYQVLDSWSPTTLTLASRPSATYTATLPPVPTSASWYVIDVTYLYRAWQVGIPFYGKLSNFGFELYSTSNADTNGSFASSNNSNPEIRPTLKIYH